MIKKLRMEVKEITEEGAFEGLLSPYGNVDAGGDLVEPGAYAKTMKERGNVVPLLWQHIKEFPIGKLTLDDRKDGLWCKGQLQMELPKAQEAYICLKNRIIKGLSIGYETVKDSIEGGVRRLKEIRLYEGSVVTFPMNEAAMVVSIKAAGVKGDFNEELAEIQTLSAFYQMQNALDYALRSLLWSSMTKDEKISMCASILEQFTEAFTAFFPAYLDTLETAYGPTNTWASSVNREMKQLLTGFPVGIKGIQALLGSGAGASTPEPEAAENEVEPAEDHSEAWVSDMLKNFKSLIQ